MRSGSLEVHIEIRDIVLDNYGHEGIVLREEPRPDRAWLAAQADPRVATLQRGERWLGVIPLAGGLVMAPASLCKRLRTATREDFLQAISMSNQHGVKYLVDLFPDFARE